MGWRRRLAFAVFSLAMASVIASAGFTTYHALSRTATVTVCGHSYPVAAGQSLTVAVSGPSCADVRVTP